MTATTLFSTPENSVIGHSRKAPDEFDEEHVTKRQKTKNEIMKEEEDAAPQGSIYTGVNEPTNTLSSSSVQQLAERGDELIPRFEPQPGEDLATHPASDETSFEQLRKNVGEVFHLCKSGKIHFFAAG